MCNKETELVETKETPSENEVVIEEKEEDIIEQLDEEVDNFVTEDNSMSENTAEQTEDNPSFVENVNVDMDEAMNDDATREISEMRESSKEEVQPPVENTPLIESATPDIFDEPKSQQTAKKKLSRFEKKKRINKVFSVLFSAAIWAIGLSLMFLCLSNVYQHIFNPAGHTGFFGIGQAVVASNSMEPKLYINDLIFYQETDTKTIEVGDIIVYEKLDKQNNPILVVHKVIHIADGYVTTQGENNAQADESFLTTNIVGKYLFKIPKLGVLLNALAESWAPILLLVFIVFIFVCRFAAFYIRKKKLVRSMSADPQTRAALEHFFDI